MFEVRNLIVAGLFLAVAVNLGWLWVLVLDDVNLTPPAVLIQNPQPSSFSQSGATSLVQGLQSQVKELHSRINDLEKEKPTVSVDQSFADLNSEAVVITPSPAQTIPTATPSPTPTSTPSPSVAATLTQESVIFLGLGSSRSLSWVNIIGTSTAINRSHYEPIQTMSLEVLGSIISGEVQVRLINQTSGEVLTSSDLVFNSSTPTWKQAGAVTLNVGAQTYVLQLKTSNGELGSIDGARLRVVKSG